MMMMDTVKLNFATYQHYKDSGVQWLGEIPSHWEVKRLKYLIALNEQTLPETTKMDHEFDYVDIGSVNFESGVTSTEKFVFRKAPSRARRRAYPGDTIISTVRTYLKAIDFIDEEKSNYIYSTGFAVLRPKMLFPKFLAFAVRSDFFTNQVDMVATGINYPAINSSNLGNLLILVPKFSEQQAIAAFLDKKTGQIEAAIARKERQIALLKEHKQIMIHQAVTRGLDPNVPMKDSGIDWIGQIPAHWEVKKLKYLTKKIGSGITPTGGGSTYVDEGIPLLRSQNILFDRINLSDVVFISEKVNMAMKNSQTKKGDVLLNITGGSIGRCHYVESDLQMNVNQHVCIIRPSSELSTIFLNSILVSEVGQGQIWFHQQGGGREGLNFQSIKNFFVPIPPKIEQQDIINTIKAKTKTFEKTISIKQKEITALKELKTSLINAAVTGKINVL